jgi:antitoxin (DNA-binding transcriptional repressor) of toxin-antitoxin stability system
MPMYLREVNLTEARKQLSSLIREIENQPDVGYQITVRNKIVAELRSPEAARLNSGAALLRAARKAEQFLKGTSRKKDKVSSENVKEYLYGRQSPLLRKRKP